jgi:hypothetical protein
MIMAMATGMIMAMATAVIKRDRDEKRNNNPSRCTTYSDRLHF